MIITSDLDHPSDQDHWLRRSFHEIKIVIFYNPASLLLLHSQANENLMSTTLLQKSILLERLELKFIGLKRNAGVTCRQDSKTGR